MTRYTAARLPAHKGPAAWAEILPDAASFPALSGQVTADFVVVGGGFAGLSAARRLGQLNPGARIILIDAGTIAQGAAGRNSGFMIDLPHDLASDDYAGKGAEADREQITLNRHAIAFARQAAQDYAIDPAFFDPTGKVNGAASPKGHAHNLSYAGHLTSLGEACEMLDADAMHALTGSRYYRSGLYTPGTVMLQPAGYCRAFALGLSRRVTLYERTPATALTRVGPDWQITTPKGQITAAKVILATNGHLESFGFAKGRLMHVMLYASMTPDLPDDVLTKLGGQARWGITPADPMGTTMRRIDTAQGGNRIITRTCASFRPDMVATDAAVRRAARVHQQKFDNRFPHLAGQQMEYRWAGHLCLTREGVSLMQELEPGLFSACVQNGLGTVRGTMTGMGAAELASGQTSLITDAMSNTSVPAKLPPRPFASIGANIFLRLKEWQAGAE